MSDTQGRYHAYHAEASVLEGHLHLPLENQIKPQAFAKLKPEGGYLSQHAKNYKLEAAISYRSAYTQVAGNRDVKPGHGWATLTTVAIEGLNVLDVLTADRVVGQIISERPLDGFVPRVSFLGTRFENLRIAGHLVDLKLDLDILGSKPANDAFYTVDPGVRARVSAQYQNIGAPNPGAPETLECSLVNQAAGAYPGTGSGHIIRVPDFGTITLAKLHLKHEYLETEKGKPQKSKTTLQLTMIDLELGCAVAGRASAGKLSTNGGPGQ